MTDEGWRAAFAFVGAGLIGVTAFSRMALVAPPAAWRGFGGIGLLAVLLAAARPDQGEAFAIRIIEQVGEDRRREARVVELEGEVVPALVRLLRPGSLGLGTTDEGLMAAAMSLDRLASVGMPSFFYPAASFSSPGVPALLRRTFWVSHVFSRGCCSARDHGLSLADLARGRLRLDRLSRNGGGETFFPWASPIPREPRKS